jgi:leader peptidase (prepilin peptidase) / N-methyltransferase
VIEVPLVVLLGVFGLLFGSFLNVCISRLPAGESVVSPRSRCPSCRTLIQWYDNIPVLSYLVLGGKCRRCRTRISARYPAIEIATSLAFIIQGLAFGNEPWPLVTRLALTGLLIALFGTDLETQRLPNVLTYSGIVAGLALSLVFPPHIEASLLGAALGAGVLLLIRWGWKMATGKDGMGLGDVKMLAMIGAFLGWQQVGVVLFLASIVGAVVGLSLAVLGGRSLQTRLPFGTFLALSAFTASVAGDSLLRWYLGYYQ